MPDFSRSGVSHSGRTDLGAQPNTRLDLHSAAAHSYDTYQLSPDPVTTEPELRLACAILIAVAVTACTGGGQESRHCAWPAEEYRRLDLTRSADRTHLRIDAESAETVAIHYADVSPARQKGREEYAQARDTCMESLFAAVARNHDVDSDLVRAYATVRNRWFDAMVLVSFALVYALIADALARRLVRLTGADDWRPAAVAVIALSLGAAVIGLMVFDLWAATAENVRLASWHLSYRGSRLPWERHRVLLIISGVGLFCLISVVRYRRAHQVLSRAA